MRIDRNVHRVLSLSGPIGGAMFFLGMMLMGFIPPPSPSNSANEILELYRTHGPSIRLGGYICIFAFALMGGFGAVLAVLMRRVEGRYSPLAYLNIMMTAVSYPAAYICFMFPIAGSYRVEHSPDLVLFINDYFWLTFMGMPLTVIVQMLAVAVCAFRDTRNNALGTVFPRWYGWYSLWECLSTCGVGVMFFTHSGVFTWSGAVTFWFYLSIYGTWLVVTSVVLFKSVNRQTDWDEEAFADTPKARTESIDVATHRVATPAH